MDRLRKKQAKTITCCSEEVSSIEWEFITMSEQEEDLIYRMHKLVGDRWALIAGRIPGRKAEEVERFWIMRHAECFASRRKELIKNPEEGKKEVGERGRLRRRRLWWVHRSVGAV